MKEYKMYDSQTLDAKVKRDLLEQTKPMTGKAELCLTGGSGARLPSVGLLLNASKSESHLDVFDTVGFVWPWIPGAQRVIRDAPDRAGDLTDDSGNSPIHQRMFVESLALHHSQTT